MSGSEDLVKERRLRVVYISPDDILRLFDWFDCGVISLPRIQSVYVKEGRVTSIHFDHTRQQFGFVLAHEDFEPVALGQMLPEMDFATVTVQRIDAEYLSQQTTETIT